MALRDEVEIEFYRAGGPGGQHRNKTETGVRLRHIPTGIVVTATERRSRTQNLSVAFERLADAVEKRTRKPKPRRKTRPSRGSVEKRIQLKKQRGSVKRDRRKPADGGE